MNTLLTTSINWSALKDSVMAFFNHFSVLYGIEILLLFTMIFFVSKVLRENEATKLMVLYWFMLVVGGAMRIFDEQLMTSSFYFIYVIVVSSMMLILFSAEVKKYFWDVHKTKEGGMLEKIHGGGSAETHSREDTERSISNIVKALQNMFRYYSKPCACN